MKKPEHILYIEFKDFLEAGWKEDTLKKANLRNGSNWMMMKNPSDLRRPMVQFDTLCNQHKEKLTAYYGDVYQYYATQPIIDLVTTDGKAESWYLAHRIKLKPLSPENVKAYTKAASWLNMLIKVNADKKYIKTVLKLSITGFWEIVEGIINKEGIALPAGYKRLREKMKEYQTKGYACIVNDRHGNTNGAKVEDELSLSVLLEMIADPQQHDDIWVMMHYNKWAADNGYDTITDATVGNYRRKHYDVIVMEREGREAYYNQYSKSIKGFRPTTPLYLVESDDNHLDLFFVDWNDKTQHKFYHKYKAIVVTDSFNDYVLGYAYAEELTTDVVKAAYLNAMYHIKELTGQWYLPRETKTDRWGLNELQPFYEKLGNYFPTPKGSKRRGYIEQFFGDVHWKRCMKYGTNNYTGNNITAANEGVNKEVLAANRKEFPTVEEAPQHIEDFFNRLRLLPTSNGVNLQEQWKEAFFAANPEQLRAIGDEEFLLKLGTEKPKTNTITSRGIDIQIGNKKYNYDIPDEYYFQYKGCDVSTIYDPNNMSRVLITDHKNFRFIATTPKLQPRAMADYKTGDRVLLNEHLDAKKKHVQYVSDTTERRKELLQQSGVDVSSLLTSGLMLKENRQMAEAQYLEDEMLHIEPAPRRRSSIDKM